MNYEKIYTASDHMEFQKILDALQEENIFAYGMERGAGQYIQIVAGMAFIEKDIYVAQEDVQKASLVIQNLKETESSQAEQENYKVPWYQNKRILVRIYVCFLLLLFLVLWVCSIVF